MHRTITVAEQDGFLRRSYPCTAALAFSRGAYPAGSPARLLDADGRELPCQVDPARVWEDGSIRTADITFAPTLAAGEVKRYTFEHGATVTPTAQVRHPVVVIPHKTGVDVQQGPITYRIRRQGFNLVDEVVFGDKAFLRPGSRGAVLVLKDGRDCLPEGDVELHVETRGPWSGRVRVAGSYGGGYTFATELTFVSTKSWYLARHRVLSGDCSQIRAVLVETDLNLTGGPLSAAFGARQCASGTATTWAVVTDGAFTVDLAVLDAWSAAGAVRYEAGADGCFRAIFPFRSDTACSIYAHYLHGQPDDVKNTPAAAMAAGLALSADAPG